MQDRENLRKFKKMEIVFSYCLTATEIFAMKVMPTHIAVCVRHTPWTLDTLTVLFLYVIILVSLQGHKTD